MKVSGTTIRNDETCKVFEVEAKECSFKSINNRYLKNIAIYWGGKHAETRREAIETESELVNFAQRFLEKNNAN